MLILKVILDILSVSQRAGTVRRAIYISQIGIISLYITQFAIDGLKNLGTIL